ncbi:MAG TPA: Smr/MutS family protein [Flavipsychrobacter sp.]
MKFSIGDKVIFKHTDGEGVITGYINTEMVEVDMDGITFPVHIDEIDHPYLKWFTEKKKQPVKKVIPEQLPVEKEKLRKQRLPKGIYLSYMPEYKIEEMEDAVDYLKIYLLNETGKKVQYRYEVVMKNQTLFTHEGKLHAFGHVYLHNIPYDSMNDLPRFNWWLDDLDDADMAPENGQLRVKPQKLFQHIDEILAKNEPSFNYLLVEDFKPYTRELPVVPEKIKSQPVTKQPTITVPGPAEVIDLHIENLVESTRGMSNADILMTQLSTLETQLRIAINSRQQRLIVIHGLGKGKLRDEVHRVLSETPEVKNYANEWMARYGFGATEVWFQY